MMTNLIYQLLIETKTGLKVCKLWNELTKLFNAYLSYCSKNKVVGVISYLITIIVGAVVLKLWLIPFLLKLMLIGAYLLGGLVFGAVLSVILLLNFFAQHL